jgi:TRAP-type C4-dicarboxylate transport system substrate-binding protein
LRIISLAAVGLITAASALASLGAAAQEYTLKLHHFLPAVAPTKMLEPWAKRVEENSGGKVKIEIFPSMSHGGTPPELIQQAHDGVVDLVWTLTGYTSGLFPRTEVFELPFIHTNDPRATNLAMYDLFADELAQEYQGLEVLFMHVHAGQAFHMVDKLVRAPDDVAGLKLRIPTRTGAWVVEALGGSPVAMPVPELPSALAKKVVDGALTPWEIIPALKIQDQTQYQIEGADQTRFGTSVFVVAMNKDRRNRCRRIFSKPSRTPRSPNGGGRSAISGARRTTAGSRLRPMPATSTSF